MFISRGASHCDRYVNEQLTNGQSDFDVEQNYTTITTKNRRPFLVLFALTMERMSLMPIRWTMALAVTAGERRTNTSGWKKNQERIFNLFAQCVLERSAVDGSIGRIAGTRNHKIVRIYRVDCYCGRQIGCQMR